MLELAIAAATTDVLGIGETVEYKHLPEWSSLSLSATPGRPSTLTFTYPRYGILAHMLTGGARIRVRFPMSQDTQLLGPDTFTVEPPNMIFVVDDFGYNEELSNDQTMSISAQSTLDSFRRLLLAPAVGSTFTDDDFLKFNNQSIGQLMKEVMSIGLSRSPETNLNMTFSTTHDSQGLPWGNAIDAKFTSGQSVLEVLEWLTSLGFAYPSFGFHSRWSPAQDAGENLTADLELDRDNPSHSFHLYSEPFKGFGLRTYYLNENHEVAITHQEEFKNVVNMVFVTGDDGICTWVKREDSIRAYGVREGKWSVSNAGLHSTLEQAGERYLDIYSYPRVSQTIDLEFPPDGATLFFFPTFVFNKSADDDKEHSIEMLSLNAPSPNGMGSLTITIDNYFDRRKVLLDQRLARLGLAQ